MTDLQMLVDDVTDVINTVFGVRILSLSQTERETFINDHSKGLCMRFYMDLGELTSLIEFDGDADDHLLALEEPGEETIEELKEELDATGMKYVLHANEDNLGGTITVFLHPDDE
jgi:hypothetical protein